MSSQTCNALKCAIMHRAPCSTSTVTIENLHIMRNAVMKRPYMHVHRGANKPASAVDVDAPGAGTSSTTSQAISSSGVVVALLAGM